MNGIPVIKMNGIPVFKINLIQQQIEYRLHITF